VPLVDGGALLDRAERIDFSDVSEDTSEPVTPCTLLTGASNRSLATFFLLAFAKDSLLDRCVLLLFALLGLAWDYDLSTGDQILRVLVSSSEDG
jgi:hypothetical protein